MSTNWFSRQARKQIDEEVFRIVFDMFYERVYQTAYYMTRDPYLAQDVVQETFIKAFRGLDSVTDARKMGAWLAVIASNTAIDLMRKRNRWNGIPTEDVLLFREADKREADLPVEAEVLRRCETEELVRLLDRLKPEYWQVLYLRYFEGLKYEEISGLLQISVGTIKSMVHRAKQQLKGHLLHSRKFETGAVEDGG